MKTLARLCGAGLLVLSPLVHAATKTDVAMKKLAAEAGCTVCHAIESGAKGPDGLPPVGPPWKDVAARYRDDKGAAERLLREVLGGTSPYARHWKDKASGLAMPPNAVAIKEADAKRLVDWILKLK